LLQTRVADILERIVVSLEDITMQELLAKVLSETGKTISLAESCTGGYVSHLITQVQGSSNYFKGAIVPYHSVLKHKIVGVSSNTLKEHTAISEETATELAENTRNI